MAVNKNTIGDKLNTAQVSINNTINDPEILEFVSTKGYNSEKMQEGRKLYDAAFLLVHQSVASTGTKEEAYNQCQNLKKIASKAFQSLAKVCRAVFIDDKSKLVFLGLVGKTPLRIPLFLKRAHSLFENAQKPEIQVELVKYGYGPEQVLAEYQKIDALSKAQERLDQMQGSKQSSTAEQRNAMKKLNAWIKRYHKIAKVALQDKPELLEKLGIRVHSTKTQAQRAAGAKAAKTRAANRAQNTTEEKPSETPKAETLKAETPEKESSPNPEA